MGKEVIRGLREYLELKNGRDDLTFDEVRRATNSYYNPEQLCLVVS